MGKGQIQNPRGTKDILPDEQKYWLYIFDVAREIFQTFSAQKIETPIFEFAEVFTRAIGKGTDIVDKEMFEVRRASTLADLQSASEDKDAGKTLILRPEYTASIMRAYIQNGMSTWPQPVKLWYWGPAFRYEKPQAGRFRIHNQVGLEIIGDASALTDTYAIYLAWRFLSMLGLKGGLSLDINSIGDSGCRGKMKKRLSEYFQNFLPAMCPDCNRRFIENPLRILDCKEEKCKKIIDNAPQIIDLLCPECKTHFKSVLENLDILGIPYNLNPNLVRGLDYYTRTVFEIYPIGDKSRQRSLVGGGRYDELAKALGGLSTPAVGWSSGIERLVEMIKDKDIAIEKKYSIDVAIIQIGEKAKKQALNILVELEKTAFKATTIIGKESLKGQLRSASKLGVRFCLIIGQREALDKTVILKDLDNGSQETVDQKKLIEILTKKLA
jgi:histidyl-tRNA synthetase